MREYSIARALLEQVEREARSRGATSVLRVRVRVGELSGVVSDLLATAYAVARQGTACSAAELEIENVPARWTCARCGAVLQPSGPLRCAGCGGPAHLAAGDEMLLVRIEMEVPAASV